jgi:transposase
MKILVAIEAVDGRKGIDSLARLCQEKLETDPFSGCLFLFRSRRGTSIRLLVYDCPRAMGEVIRCPNHERSANERQQTGCPCRDRN